MDCAKTHAITETEEATLRVCQLRNGKKRTGFGGYQKLMRWVWDPSHLLSCPAEGKSSSETPGGKPQGASSVYKQMWIHGLAGLLVTATGNVQGHQSPSGFGEKSPKQGENICQLL